MSLFITTLLLHYYKNILFFHLIASLPSLDTDPNTLFDFEGRQMGQQIITIEGVQIIANRYYVAVYNQRYSGAALRYTLEISSKKTDEKLPTCTSSPCSTHSMSCVENTIDGRTCTCHPAWSGTTCESPVLRSTASLLHAASNIISLGNNANTTVSMKRGDFSFFKVPQPLKKGQGTYSNI